MSDLTAEEPTEPVTGAATATAEPPKPPAAPPATGVAAPGPGHNRGRGCLIAGVLVAVVVLLALGGLVWWAALQPGASTTSGPTVGSAADTSAFGSAMRKAGVKAPPAPTSPVPLTSVKPLGSHPFDATFTFEELAAVLRAFSYTPKSATSIRLRVDALSQTGGDLRLDGEVTAAGSSYGGYVQGPVRFVGGKIVPDGSFTANAGGISVGGAQAAQAAGILLEYLNRFLAAAPGLKVSSAAVVTGGVHVTGTAPDSISW